LKIILLYYNAVGRVPSRAKVGSGQGRTSSSKVGRLQEVFNLEEGPVTLMYPATLSSESYQDLADHLAIFLLKAKRRSDAVN
jgi:hypothetical protein